MLAYVNIFPYLVCMNSGIYKITNTVNDMCYIGSSKNIKFRLKIHRSLLRRNKHHNIHLQRAWNKYGEEAFKEEILELCPKKDRLSGEQYYINLHDFSKLYNINDKTNSVNQDQNKKALLLLDLKGNVVNEFSSGLELARSFGSRDLVWANVNTQAIYRNQYRIVEIKFYNNNEQLINSWPEYTDQTHWSLFQRKYVYTIGELQFDSTKDVAKYLGVSRETVRKNLIGKTRHYYKSKKVLVRKIKLSDIQPYKKL